MNKIHVYIYSRVIITNNVMYTEIFNYSDISKASTARDGVIGICKQIQLKSDEHCVLDTFLHLSDPCNMCT